jgi:lipopolysaccharide transport system ATP-binding protein
VRLGFAIAAHLEPEILVVDEVLAVGDAEFQKKAIGKMQDVSKGQGRTVLFVSHNMAAVKSLCTRGIVFNNGQLVFQGNIKETLSFYLNEVPSDMKGTIINSIKVQKPTIRFDRILINGTENRHSTITCNQNILELQIEGETTEELNTDVMLIMRTKDGIPLATLAEGHYRGIIQKISAGRFVIKKNIVLPRFLSNGQLYCDLMMHHPMVEWQLKAPNCCILDCEGNQEGYGHFMHQDRMGVIGLVTKN